MDGPKGPNDGDAAEEAGDGVQEVTREEKNKLPTAQDGASASRSDAISGAGSARAMASYDRSPGAKPKVAYHDPTIPRPQDEHLIVVDNSNSPFQHVWLELSEDGTRRIHPLEKLHVEQFIDRNFHEIEPVRPAAIEDTPFTLVEKPDGLAELANKLKNVNEFAVDLEHHQYRSFQGLTCLMQISTRTEDFIIDTFKLRIYINLYLKEHFEDPTKRKVMHGADRDIMWLQRDFRIYVCNLFDTGQASKVLKMERNTLEHLLRHFCGVTADKTYQNADWRLRPLSDEMIKYAREDTHYLLYIYDLMRHRLQRESPSGNDLLLEVHNRSNDICLPLYEKELLTDKSYLYIYGLNEHELEANQLAVVSALYHWRDCIARKQDESTGYVLPNKALIEIAKKMPTTIEDLKRIVKSKYPIVEDNSDLILGVIWSAIGNSNAFEAIAEQLKKARLSQLDLKSILDTGEVNEMALLDGDNVRISLKPADQYSVAPSSTANISVTSNSRDSSVSDADLTGSMQLHENNNTQTIHSSETKTSWVLSGLNRPFNKEVMSNNKQGRYAFLQELKSMPFDALEGTSTSGMQTNYYGGYSNEQLDLKSILDTGEVIEMAVSDGDNVRISLAPADQYSVAPSSTANISVTSNSRDSSVSDAALTGSMRLHENDNTETIPSSKTKTSWALSGLNRPFNKEVMSNNKQGTHAFLQELNSHMPFGALEGTSTSGMQTNYYGGYSNEQLDLKSILDTGEVIETTLLDGDNPRISLEPAGQYSVAPSSTANISVTSNSRDSSVGDAALTGSMRLHENDNTQTIPSSETKTSWALSGLNRPFNKEVMSNNKQGIHAFLQEQPMPFGALEGTSTSGMQTNYYGGYSNEQLDLKSILDTGEVTEMALLDGDNARISLEPADQYSVAPSSTANIGVTSNSRDSSVSDAALTGSMRLHENDNTQTIPSSETKTSWALSGLNRPFNKDVMSNNKQGIHAFLQEQPMPFGALEGTSTSGMQTNYYGGYSNEQAQGHAYYYPQFPDYSNLGGWSSHHGPEGMQPSGYHHGPEGMQPSGYHHGTQGMQHSGYHHGPQGMQHSGYHHGPQGMQPSGYDQSGCYYGPQPAVYQSSTGSGQPAAAARNNGGGFFQDVRNQHFFPRRS